MVAKIKERNPYAKSGHRHKPRGVKDKDFERVYWPFLPVLIATGILLSMAIHTGSIATYLRHPAGRVLAYSNSEDPALMLSDTNYQREADHEADLALNAQLAKAAQAKAQDMANRDYWSHYTPDGQPPWVFATNAGYNYQKLGENLATGFPDEASVVKAWMASPAHRDNVLDPSYTQVGFGFANVADYKAAGGGPMTIVVAFYCRPDGLVDFAIAHNTNQQTPSTTNSNLTINLASQTTRASLAFSKLSASSWGGIAVLLCLAGLAAMQIIKHAKAFRVAIRNSERFIWHHPLVDLCVLLAAGALIALMQTAGFIQ